MKIINNKQKALKELRRISQRTTAGNNKKINSIVEDILQEVKVHGDIAVEKYTKKFDGYHPKPCLLYTSPSPRDRTRSRMPSSA